MLIDQKPPEQNRPSGVPYRLGRLYAPDPRDRAHTLDEAALRQMPRAITKPRKNPWRIGPILDQGSTSECTVFAFAQWYQSAPRLKRLPWDRGKFTEVYKLAQKRDEWPGENYDGTSERAVLKVAEDAGLLKEYKWVADEDVAQEYLKTRGGLCFGCDWFNGFFSPDARGYIEPTGNLAGGHETYLRWYHNKNHWRYPDSYEFVNSWGPQWGPLGGRFLVKADLFRYLFLQLNGDLVSPIENLA